MGELDDIILILALHRIKNSYAYAYL